MQALLRTLADQALLLDDLTAQDEVRGALGALPVKALLGGKGLPGLFQLRYNVEMLDVLYRYPKCVLTIEARCW